MATTIPKIVWRGQFKWERDKDKKDCWQLYLGSRWRGEISRSLRCRLWHVFLPVIVSKTKTFGRRFEAKRYAEQLVRRVSVTTEKSVPISGLTP